MNADESDHAEVVPFLGRPRAGEADEAVASDDNGGEAGISGTPAATVPAEAGTVDPAEAVVELALKLADAFERIAAEQGLAAADLAEVWFVE